MLTNEERQALRQIERAMHESDPRLVMLLSGGRAYRRTESRRRLARVIVDLFAVATMVLAAATGLLVLIFLCALATVAAACMHIVHKRARLV